MDGAAEANPGAFHPDFTVVMADNGLDNEETETTAANIFVFAPGPITHVEDPVNLAAFEAATTVSHREVSKSTIAFEGDGDFRGGIGIKDRIFDEIAQGRFKGFGFADDLQPFFDVEGHRSGAGERI